MLSDRYQALLSREFVPPSWIIALLPATRTESPGVTDVLAALDGSSLAVEDAYPDPENIYPDSQWEMVLRIRFDDEVTQFRVNALHSEQVSEFHLQDALLSQEEQDIAVDSAWSLGLSVDFGDQPLRAYHHQLIVLSTLAPDAVIFHDVTACRVHSSGWVREAASSGVPPAPEWLFSIHAVYDQDGSSKDAWLHTHGLLRCGIPELEMAGLPKEAGGVCSRLINTIASLFMEHSLPDPGEAFLPAEGMELVWLPWEEGLSKLPRRCLGHKADRDEYHNLPSAILFAPRRGLFRRRYDSPAVYRDRLEENPLLFISDMETERMSALARERFDHFSHLVEQFAGEEEWSFLVKLGYPVDDAEESTDREHLWFEVHRLLEGAQGEDPQCEATLLNQPYAIASMHEGQRAQYDLSLMSDWNIICQMGQFGPDTVFHLERELSSLEPPLDEL